MVSCLRWKESEVEILDQLLLPNKTQWVRCVKSDEVADCISTMKIRGAPAIGVAAAMGLALAVREPAAAGASSLAEHFEAACRRMASARPTAVNLTWAVERMRRVFDGVRPLSLEAAQAALRDEALSIDRLDKATCAAMGANGLELIPPGARILTHCNTGSLATAGAGTALAVVREAHANGRLQVVWVDETRPYLQGARLTSWELAQDGIPQRLITDNMAAFLMARGQVDLVILGADRIAANGDVANKIGTYGLAVLAHHHGVPFYVAAPMSTVDATLRTGAEIPIEERPSHELTRIAGVEMAPEGVPVWNPAFDVTPHKLITAIVTDVAVLRPPYDIALARALRQSRTD